MAQRHTDHAGVHEREPEQQRPVNQAPVGRLGDHRELRGTIADEQRMFEAGDPKQQGSEEQAKTVEQRTAGHDHGALI